MGGGGEGDGEGGDGGGVDGGGGGVGEGGAWGGEGDGGALVPGGGGLGGSSAVRAPKSAVARRAAVEVAPGNHLEANLMQCECNGNELSWLLGFSGGSS